MKMDIENVWRDVIPDSVLLQIFSNLRPWNLKQVCQVCRRWWRVALDESIWRNLFYNAAEWKVKGPVELKGDSWYTEYKRLYYHTPTQLSERFEGHIDEVLDVTFSHDGKVFCTTSKDATVKIWEIGCPTRLKFSKNLGDECSWNLTQYAAFNKSDTLLLVCGVKITEAGENQQYYLSSLGFGAVFRMKDFQLLQIMPMDPPHLFADWFDDEVCVGGYIDPARDNTKLNIRAFKVDTEGRSLKAAIDGPLVYSFNGNTHHTMNVLIASVPKPERHMKHQDTQITKTDKPYKEDVHSCSEKDMKVLEDSLNCFHIEAEEQSKSSNSLNENTSQNCNAMCTETAVNKGTTGKQEYFYDRNSNSNLLSTDQEGFHSVLNSKATDPGEVDLDNQGHMDKYMVFVAGEHDTLAFHKVNDLKTRLEKELLRLDARRKELGIDCDTPCPVSLRNAEDIYKIIRLPGSYICGLSLSPDQRYLFFNYRQQIEELDDNGYPKLLESIELKTVDMQTFRLVPEMTFTGHKASSDIPAWYICLDSCADFIASGSEEALGYLWDKHYKIILAQYRHIDGVVNGVSFNPVDNECLATVADDKVINIWRSRNQQKEYQLNRVIEEMEHNDN